jgi:phosphate transport system substrate-binding protein
MISARPETTRSTDQMRRTTLRAAALLAATTLLVTACGGSDDTTAAPAPVPAAPAAPSAPEAPAPAPLPAGDLVGAGATFVNPIFVDWIFEYNQKVNSNANINYQSIGSGGGIRQFLEQTVDFGASERYLRAEQLQRARRDRGCDAIQFPIVFGSVTIAFHDAFYDGLILDGTTIGDIFERRITKYNDPKIAALNPGRELRNEDIIPVHRSDGSGTTSVFTTYLDKDSTVEGWTLGNGTEVQWPAGTIGGQGNEGVAAAIQQNPGALGYLNQAYILIQGFPQARVVNADGNAVLATLEATKEGAEVAAIPSTFQFDILDIGGQGFPITGTAWVFVWECGYDETTEALLKDFWTWAVTEGGPLAEELGYVGMGEGLGARVLEAIDRINVLGENGGSR